MFKNRCYNGGTQHKFEARFEEKPRILERFKASVIDVEKLRKLITINIYLGDICVWCGKTVLGLVNKQQ